jgi:hypothetical protein
MFVGMFTLLPRDSYGFPTTRSSRALISVSHEIVKIPEIEDFNEGQTKEHNRVVRQSDDYSHDDCPKSHPEISRRCKGSHRRSSGCTRSFNRINHHGGKKESKPCPINDSNENKQGKGFRK